MKLVVALAFLLSVISVKAYAGGAYIGKLQPFFYNNRLFLIPIESTISSRPSCATRRYLRLSNEIGDPVFNAKYSLILSAWAAKQELVIEGTGTCTSEGDEIIMSILPK